MHILM